MIATRRDIVYSYIYGEHKKKKTAGSKDAVPRTQGKWTIKPRITGMQFSSLTE